MNEWSTRSVQLEPENTTNLPETQPKKTKLDLRTEKEHERIFNNDWELLYFTIEQDGKPFSYCVAAILLVFSKFTA